MTTTAPAMLSRTEARWALAQTRVVDMATVTAYAEMYTVIASGLLVAVDPPEKLVRKLILETLSGEKRWDPSARTFAEHLCKAVRLEVWGAVTLHARMRGGATPTPEVRLCDKQVGDLRGLDQTTHWAAQMNARVREGDAAVLAIGVRLSTFANGRLTALAGNPDDEDTARITRPTDNGNGGAVSDA